MEQTDEEFFHDFRQELLAGAEANGSFQLSEFMEAIANDLGRVNTNCRVGVNGQH